MKVFDCVECIKAQLPQSAILMQLAEECAETAKAALKLARIYQGVNPTPIKEDEAMEMLTEEIADIAVCIDCLADVDYDKIAAIQISKVERWASRLAKARGK